MGADFIIRELNELGGVPPPNNKKYVSFRWDSGHRNIPRQPWTFGVHQRTVRTEYPGADDPTEQVLGPNFTPFTLEGRWDDRYNPLGAVPAGASGTEAYAAVGGYADKERKKFEEMVRRGNLVQITFEDINFVGIVTDFEVDYRRKFDIGYRFTFSPHHRQPSGFFALKRSPRSALNATQLRNEVNAEVETATELHERAPQTGLVKDIYLDAEAYINEWTTGIVAIDDAIEQRQLTPELEPMTSLMRLAAQFYSMGTIGYNLIVLLKSYDSSEALNYESAGQIMDFDVWARGLMYVARRIVVRGQRAAADMQQRAEPNAIGLYAPQIGESLYKISNRFYRTPHNWRIIAQRNYLTSFALTGTELLVIPEITQR